MRIVYMLTSLGVGGAERQALAIAERIAGRGHAVAIVTLRPRLDDEWPTSLPVRRLNLRKNPASFLAAVLRARRFLRDFRPDLVHSHSFHANILARLLKLVFPAPAFISTIHNVQEGGRSRIFAYRLTDRLCRQTTAVSQAVADRFIALHAVPAAKCAVMHNAIDAAGFVANPARRAEARIALAANADFIWLTAGRLAPSKDYPNLLRAFATLRRTCPDARLWIAGQGTHAQVSALHFLAATLGLDHSIEWLGLRRDMAALLDAADAFVLGSAWEGMPLALAEAMAMEKPLVATDVGGVQELVGESGILVPARSAANLADGMLELMHRSVELRQSQARAARRRIQQYFSIEARANDWEALYNDLLNPAANPRE
jgi:glycosyltransferase involved in cell wall biosynthesis